MKSEGKNPVNPKKDSEMGRPRCHVSGVWCVVLAAGSIVTNVSGKIPTISFTGFTYAAQDARMQMP